MASVKRALTLEDKLNETTLNLTHIMLVCGLDGILQERINAGLKQARQLKMQSQSQKNLLLIYGLSEDLQVFIQMLIHDLESTRREKNHFQKLLKNPDSENDGSSFA